jgi:oligosaccharyltransferase complex subunit alpha (ribophorin I)
LNYTFLHNYEEILTENYTLKVILPEGATNIKAHIPFEIDSETRDLHFSTLDYFGKPVIVIKKSNVLSRLHNVYF